MFSANAKIQTTNLNLRRRRRRQQRSQQRQQHALLVDSQITKATPTATTTITARVVIGTTVIAVEHLLKKASATR